MVKNNVTAFKNALKMGAIGENIWDFATAQGLKPVATVDGLKK